MGGGTGSAGLAGVLRVLIGYAGYGSRIKSTKKSADLHQAAESSVEIFRSGDRSPAHRPFWVKAPYRLQRQVAGSGFPNHS